MPADPPTHYTLTMTARQARVIQNALDLAARLGMGCLRDVADHTPAILDGRCDEDFIRLREGLDALQHLAHGIPGGGSNSHLGIAAATEPARMAWDICRVIRYRDSHDRADARGEPADKRWACSYDDPSWHVYGPEPLPTIAPSPLYSLQGDPCPSMGVEDDA